MQRMMSAAWNVSRETLERLDALRSLLELWNPSAKLVSGNDLPLIQQRHFADSIALVPLLRDAEAIADLGSGGGFPGLVLAIVTGRPITLIEADQRKAAFLREAARVTAAPACVVDRRIEAVSGLFDLITARAVARLPTLLSLIAPRLRPEGRCVFPKGRDHEAEVSEAARLWDFDVICHPSGTSAQSCILELAHVRPRLSA